MTKNVSRPTDEELADQAEQNRDDLSGWQPATKKIRFRRGGPSSVFSVRFSLEELQQVQSAADQQDITVSAFIRDASLAAAAREARTSAGD